jgi:dolichol kinase/phosphoserine phosphatase
MDIGTVVERAYALLAGCTLEELLAVGERLRLAKGATEVCRDLRRAGYLVVLVSAGVPQEVLELVATRVGAQAVHGVLLETESGRLTGRLLECRHTARGKRDGLEKILRRWGFSWREVTVVVDDASNWQIVDAAWRSVAVNPEWSITKTASFVLYTRNLREILGFFPEGYETGITPAWLAVRHELFRKSIHLCAVAVPLLAMWSPAFTLWLVGIVTLCYAASELLRVVGVALPLFSAVTWRAMRSAESRGLVLGPFLFGVGIWLTLELFPLSAATVGILVLAIGDGAASLTGRLFGRTALVYNRQKTLVGSLTVFVVGAVVAMSYLPLGWSLAVGIVASLLESLPLGAYDNLLLPLASAGMVSVAVTLV